MTSDEAEARKAFEAWSLVHLRSAAGRDNPAMWNAWLASWAAARKDVDELLDCLTRAMQELGIAYLVTGELTGDPLAIMDCLVKHGRVVIDGDRYRWANQKEE